MHIFNRQNVCLLSDTDTIEFVEKQTTFSEKYELHRYIIQKCCRSGTNIFGSSFLYEQKEIERFSNLL